MALIIEDGTIVAGAESYVTAAEATTYHSNRGNTAWTGTDAVKEAALRKAVAYLDGHYFSRWKGTLVKPLEQSLQWPRYNVNIGSDQTEGSYRGETFGSFLAPDVIPQKVKDAQCELALRALSGTLAADLERGGKISSVTVGPISQTFSDSAPASTTYPLVDKLLIQFITGQKSNLVRS